MICYMTLTYFVATLHLGVVLDKQKRRVRALHGKWTDSLWTMDLRDSRHFVDNESLFNGVIMSKSESSILYSAQRAYDDQIKADLHGSVLSSTLLSRLNAAADSVSIVSNDAISGNRASSSCKEPAIGAEERPISPDLPDPAPLPDGLHLPEIHHLPSAFCLWKADPRPDQSRQYYNFTRFAMMLNEMNPEQTCRLPATDCRFRPDIRALENGDLEAASREKERLEQKQRALIATHKRDCRVWTSLWFHLGTNRITGLQDWNFNPDYCRRDWSMVPDLF